MISRLLILLLLPLVSAFVAPSGVSRVETLLESTRAYERQRTTTYPRRESRGAGGSRYGNNWWESSSRYGGGSMRAYDERSYDRRRAGPSNYRSTGYGRYESNGVTSYDHPDSPIEGGSRRTLTSGFPYYSNQHEWHVNLDTDGRPLDAEIEVWDGPNNSVQKVRTHSMDGDRSRFQGVFNGGESMSIRNTGPVEFPTYTSTRLAPSGSRISDFGRTSPPVTVQGDNALKTWTFPQDVDSVLVELESQGMPVDAVVEIWQGPNNVQQVAEIYSQDGYNRPYATIVDTSGHWGTTTLAVRNVGPMAFPLTARVEPRSYY